MIYLFLFYKCTSFYFVFILTVLHNIVFFTNWRFVASFSGDGTFTNILTFWVIFISSNKWGFPGGSDSKESACNAGDLGLIPGQEDPLEKGMATHFSFLAWKIPLTDETDGLQSMGPQKVRHDWANKNFHLASFFFRLKTFYLSLVSLPKKSILFFNQEIFLFCFYFWKLFILIAYRILGWQFPLSSTLSSFFFSFSWWDASSLSIMAFSCILKGGFLCFDPVWGYLQEFDLPIPELWLL